MDSPFFKSSIPCDENNEIINNKGNCIWAFFLKLNIWMFATYEMELDVSLLCAVIVLKQTFRNGSGNSMILDHVISEVQYVQK